MEILESEIKDVIFFRPKRYEDERGFFSEIYNKQVYKKIGIDCNFVQDAHSFSKNKGTVRALHFQKPPFSQSQLVKVLKGSIFDVVIDIRPESSTFGAHSNYVLSEENGRHLFVPEGFAHGFMSLEENTEVYYKMSQFYSPEHDAGIIWNDKELGIEWPDLDCKLTISGKDSYLPTFSDIKATLI